MGFTEAVEMTQEIAMRAMRLCLLILVACSSSDDGPDASMTADRPGVPDGSQFSLRFFGQGGLDDDRVKIRLDDPATTAPGPALDVGDDDFTIEFWMRARAEDNPNVITCGGNTWTESNIIIDRDRHSQPRSFGVGVANGVALFNVTSEQGGSETICGQVPVLDDQWHHIAVQRRRSDGLMSVYVDGALDVSVDGPDGDISYPDDGEPLDVCPGGLCDYSDPFLVLGAEKHGYENISYNGYIDELRVSTALRYTGEFAPERAPFVADADTVGLYHFDSGMGAVARDDSAAPSSPHDGQINVGGTPPGPEWSTESPF